ncbi:hypothetical protein LBP_cg1633 [Lactiplantibacillus plantarum subsp. plantarum P-8]|nr:hypothetical protein LBP_cg1633 [Lactiplantibacillus plantarum subsp. plantarum P-8]
MHHYIYLYSFKATMKNKKTPSTQRLTTLKVGTDNQFKESTGFEPARRY